MAGSVNKVILIGNLGKDPEVRHLENGAAVANFSIATSENYKDRKTGEKVSETEWLNIVASKNWTNQSTGSLLLEVGPNYNWSYINNFSDFAEYIPAKIPSEHGIWFP